MDDQGQKHFGVVLTVSGGALVDAEIKKIGTTAEQTHAKIVTSGQRASAAMGATAQSITQGHRGIQGETGKTTNTLETMASALAKNTVGASLLLRTLGGLGGGSAELAAKLERVALTSERMAAAGAAQLTSQDVLNRAYQEGSIAAATIEAAQARLTSARRAAAEAERAYASALETSSAKQAELRMAQSATGLAQVGVTSEKQYLSDAQARMAATTSLKEYEAAERDAAMASTNLAAEQKILSGAVAAQKIAMVEARESTVVTTAAKQEMTVANKELAASEKLVAEAGSATGIGLAGVGAIVAGLVLVLVGLAAAFYAVEKAWHTLKESFAEGAKMEQARVGLESLLGSAQKATDVLNGLRELSVKSGGRFSIEGLSDAAVKMNALGVDAGNLLPRLTAFAQLASRTTSGTIEGIVQIYDRSVDSITSGMGLSTRELRSFTNQGVNLSDMLAKSMGTTSNKAKELILARKVSVEQLNAAFESMLLQDGALEKRGATWTGLIGKIKAGWGEVLARFSEPILVKIEPLLELIVKHMPEIEDLAARAGKAVAGLIDDLTHVATGNTSWLDELFVAWQTIITKMANFALETLVRMFKEIGPAASDAMWAGLAYGMNMKMRSVGNFFNPFIGWTDAGLMAVDKLIEKLKLKLPEISKVSRGVIDASFGANTTDQFASGEKPNNKAINLALAEHRLLLEKIRGEQQLLAADPFISPDDKQIKGLRQMHDELDQLAGVMKQDQALFAATLDQPDVHQKVRADLQKDTQAFQLLQLKIQEAEHPIAAAIGKWSQAIGTFAHQVAKAAVDIANALANDISNGLTDILDGTKSAAQGFKDMAISIIKDIERIIIKMEVELLLQRLIGGLGGVGSGGGGSTTIGVGAGGSGGFATGGPIHGPSHAGGGVRIEAEGGEYMLRKEAARNQSLENLDALNRGQAHIIKMQTGGNIPNVGLYGTSGNLPSGPGGMTGEPSILPGTQNYVGRGYLTPPPGPTVTLYHGVPGDHGAPYWESPPTATGNVEAGATNNPPAPGGETGRVITTSGSGNDRNTVRGGGGTSTPGQLSIAQYNQATFGGITPTGYRDMRGSATFNSQAAGALMMWYQSMGGNPNNPPAGDEGHTVFRNLRLGIRGYFDPEQGVVTRLGHWENGRVIRAEELPRYHEGGVVGDEMPIMAKRGERVIPVGGGGATVAPGAIQVSVTYVDGNRTEKRSKGDAREADELRQMLEGVMDQWALKNSRHGGALTR